MVTVSKIIMNKYLMNCLTNKRSVFDANPLKIDIIVDNQKKHDFKQNP